MTEYFKTISESDFTKLKDAIALITVLIGGADGELDQDERKWAEKVTKIRSYKMSEDLMGFYQEVGVDFADRLDHYIKVLPADTDSRTEIVSGMLSELNPILKNLEPHVAYHLYKSYLSFAKHVAKASGGFLGFFSIGPKEGELLGLEMLDEITFPDEGEEE